MNHASENLILRVWWSWNPVDSSVFSLCYHWFNIGEGIIWLVFAFLVAHRFLLQGRSRLELVYCGSFIVFAATDFCEAWQQSTWLILLKGANLFILFGLRHHVLNTCYPRSRLY